MAKHGLAIMIADKMPPPDKLKKSDSGDYGADDGDSDGSDDEEMELSTMADFRKCLRAGDDKSALGHLRDLISMLQGPGEEE